MTLHKTVHLVTQRIVERSLASRKTYLANVKRAAQTGPRRARLSCGNLAHAIAACPADDKAALAHGTSGNLGIITAYNDMLSAHRPFERYPDVIREAVRTVGGTAQVAGGVPAMCDGVTQGQPGMELSLFSRDIIAMSAAVALSHNCFDAAVYLGVCDKIVPGLVIAAATFGHLPAVFLPAGPMRSGLPNDQKAKVRQQYAAGEVGRDALLRAEMQSYHGPGTCTFYGTANSNQMLMEFMGLHMPGASFINPDTPLREAMTRAGAIRALQISALGKEYTPVAEILDERAFVNAIVGLLATGGSTNLVIHLCAMARAAGVVLDLEDFSDLSAITPLLARVYPNGLADVNHFHAAGGLGFVIGELLDAGFLHPDTRTIVGRGLAGYTREPVIGEGEKLSWRESPRQTQDDNVARPASKPFQSNGGLQQLTGNLGRSVIKTSAVAPKYHVVQAPVRVFENQEDVKVAFRAGELNTDVVVVVRFQGPRANGMPELHSLTPMLGILQDKGFKVALLTDGRMSGASGKVPAALHLSPEACDGGPIARLRDGDVVRLDATTGSLQVMVSADQLAAREPASPNLSDNHYGCGRELFNTLRAQVGSSEHGASVAV